MRFFLTGFMGCGKSFWARKLSERYHLKFIDLDEQVELGEQQSIAQLFEQLGEEGFRACEQKYLQSCCSSSNSFVMACGGGTPCVPSNLALMKAAGKIIYLKAGADYLVHRLQHETSHRPLIKALSGSALSDYIKLKLAERTPAYEQCDFSLNAENLNETIFDPIFLPHV